MKLRYWWLRLAEPFKSPIRAEKVGELPDVLLDRRLYLVGDADEHPWQAAMACPCKCGSTIHLSLVPGDKPRWKAHSDGEGLATLWPSVARHRGCTAHFILTGGKIRWV